MDEIALHIEFLLHSHDCVIVPGLGGFVVNVSDVERNGLWGVDAPKCELLFNSKLTYNDGLLTESLMKTNKISFETASGIINAACEELKKKLAKEKQVVWSSLGTFKEANEVDEKNRPVFIPNKYFIRPSFYGLTNARLKPVALLSSKNSDESNLIPLKPFIQYVSSAIAMALVLFIVVVSYSNHESKSQRAEIVSKSIIFNKKETNVAGSKAVKSVYASNANVINTKNDNSSIPPPSQTNTSLSQSTSDSNYYIIVGVYGVRDVAEKTLSTLQAHGFVNASMLERTGRLDVYAASFTNKDEAQSFLSKFQSENPKYHDAWLLKR